MRQLGVFQLCCAELLLADLLLPAALQLVKDTLVSSLALVIALPLWCVDVNPVGMDLGADVLQLNLAGEWLQCGAVLRGLVEKDHLPQQLEAGRHTQPFKLNCNDSW